MTSHETRYHMSPPTSLALSPELSSPLLSLPPWKLLPLFLLILCIIGHGGRNFLLYLWHHLKPWHGRSFNDALDKKWTWSGTSFPTLRRAQFFFFFSFFYLSSLLLLNRIVWVCLSSFFSVLFIIPGCDRWRLLRLWFAFQIWCFGSCCAFLPPLLFNLCLSSYGKCLSYFYSFSYSLFLVWYF